MVLRAPYISASGVTGPPFNPPENSIAVMSFLNMGSNPENEYFSQGVPDTILIDREEVRRLHKEGKL